MKTPLLDGIEKSAAIVPYLAGGGIGAGLGALIDSENRKRGALRGLVLGGLTGMSV